MEETWQTAKGSNRMVSILEAAARQFYEKGYHATTIEDIAGEVGMLKGSIYYYIESKEELLYEIFLDVIEHGQAGVEKALEGITDPAGQLDRGLEQHIEAIIRNQARVGLFLHEFNVLSKRRKQHVQEARKKYQKIFVEIIARGQKSGAFMEGDPDLFVNAVLGMCNWICRWYRGENSPPLETVKKTYVGIIKSGIVRQKT